MTPHEEANRRRWDELAPLHFRSAFYDVAGFKAGKTSLLPLEIEEVGDVAGKSLLHLQCHFGLDTLSWARRGAAVTGADAAPAAVDLARQLAAEVGLPATFVAARVQDLADVPELAERRFDVVVTTYGVLCWLPDLRPWARTVAHFLRPGGVFYLAESHPLADILDDPDGSGDLRPVYPYFDTSEPVTEEARGTYADRSAAVQNRTTHLWSHPFGSVLTALLEVGLRLEFVREHAVCPFQRYATMTRDADGWYRLPEPLRRRVPLLFSLRAHRPGGPGSG